MKYPPEISKPQVNTSLGTDPFVTFFVLRSLWSPLQAQPVCCCDQVTCASPSLIIACHSLPQACSSPQQQQRSCSARAFKLALLDPARALLCHSSEPSSPPNPVERSPGTPVPERYHQPHVQLRGSPPAVQTKYLYPTRTSHLSSVTPTSPYI